MVARKDAEGKWTCVRNITEAHPDFHGTCPRVTPDGQYVFFNRYENGQANVYWVSADVLSSKE
jgi:hypothetical protein